MTYPIMHEAIEIIIDSTNSKLTIFDGEAPTDRKIAISRLLLFKPAIVIAIIPRRAITIINNVIILKALSNLAWFQNVCNLLNSLVALASLLLLLVLKRHQDP